MTTYYPYCQARDARLNLSNNSDKTTTGSAAAITALELGRRCLKNKGHPSPVGAHNETQAYPIREPHRNDVSEFDTPYLTPAAAGRAAGPESRKDPKVRT